MRKSQVSTVSEVVEVRGDYYKLFQVQGIKNLNVSGYSRKMVNNDPIERGVDGFSYFSLIFSYFIF